MACDVFYGGQQPGQPGLLQQVQQEGRAVMLGWSETGPGGKPMAMGIAQKKMMGFCERENPVI